MFRTMKFPKTYQIIFQTNDIEIILEDLNGGNSGVANCSMDHWIATIYGISDQADDFHKIEVHFDMDNKTGHDLYIYKTFPLIHKDYAPKCRPRIGVRRVY